MQESWNAENTTTCPERSKQTCCFKIHGANTTDNCLEEFAKHTSIHGFKYAFKRDLPLFERWTWMLFIALCTVAAALLLYTSVEKFYTNPTITAIDFMGAETRTLPFPAITFCNVNSIFRYKAIRMLEELHIPSSMNLSLERLKGLLPNVGHLFIEDVELNDSLLHDFRLLEHILDENGITVPQAAKMLSQSCPDMVELCVWEGKPFDCATTFKKWATFNGYCCSFNNDVKTNWKGHSNSDSDILRSHGYGKNSGLRVLLNPMEEEYLLGRYVSVGFSVAVHRSGIYPEGRNVFIGPNKESFIRVYPVCADGEEGLKTVQPNRRGCTFFNERKLMISKLYSREACVLQCRANAILNLCGCIPFHYANQGGNVKTEKQMFFQTSENISTGITFCTLRHMKCLRENFIRVNSEDTVDECECWPQCKFISYGYSTSTTRLEAVEHYVGDFYKGVNTTGRASVTVFFASENSELNKRALIYSVGEFMSKMGGIFSLFLGCSFLTAMEFVYFFLFKYSSYCIKKSIQGEE